jgi:hypothetical protein
VIGGAVDDFWWALNCCSVVSVEFWCGGFLVWRFCFGTVQSWSVSGELGLILPDYIFYCNSGLGVWLSKIFLQLLWSELL